jgi:hypothetical protein
MAGGLALMVVAASVGRSKSLFQRNFDRYVREGVRRPTDVSGDWVGWKVTGLIGFLMGAFLFVVGVVTHIG